MRRLVIIGAILAAFVTSPYQLTHYLTPACSWASRSEFRLFGVMRSGDKAAQERCWARKGLKSSTPIAIILTRFP